jgi:hypothetical protein
MARPRHSALIRAFALVFLFWVGLDFGVHGLFACDLAPIGTRGPSSSLCAEGSGAGVPSAPDHCFCHGLSMGAVVPARTASLAPTGTLVINLSPHVPSSDPNPLDKPPQHTA